MQYAVNIAIFDTIRRIMPSLVSYSQQKDQKLVRHATETKTQHSTRKDLTRGHIDHSAASVTYL